MTTTYLDIPFRGSRYWNDAVATSSALPTTDPAGTVRAVLDTGLIYEYFSGAWTAIGGATTVTGPASSSDGGIALFNGTTGVVIKQATGSGFVKATSGVYGTSASVSLTADVSGTLPVANGGTGVTASTGSVAVVLSTSPTLVTPLLGTPQSGVLTSCTGLPLTTGITGTLAIGNGGTGQATQTAAYDALSPLTTAGDVVYGGVSGSGTRLAKGTSVQVLHSGTTPSWGAVSLTADVSGTLPVANGGTGVTASTGTVAVVLSTSPTLVTPILGTPQSGTLTTCTGLPLTTGVTGTLPIGNGGTGQATKGPAFDALSPMTAAGDVIYGGVSGTGTTLAKGTSVQVLHSGTTPAWGAVSLTADVSGTLPVANGGTGVTSSTGTVAVVLSTSPTLITPILGTPQSGTLTTCTGLPLTTGVTGTLPVANGGTNLASGTAGNALYFSGTTTIGQTGTAGLTVLNGSSTGTAASAGFVGQILESHVTSSNSLTANVMADLTTITLTAGIWDVYYSCFYTRNGATITANIFICGLSATSGDVVPVARYDTTQSANGTWLTTFSTGSLTGYARVRHDGTNFLDLGGTTPTGTTLRLKIGEANFTGGPILGYGALVASRVV